MDSCCEHRLLPILAGLVILIVDLVVLKMQKKKKVPIHLYLCVCVCMYTHLHPLFSLLCPLVFTWLEAHSQGMLSN